MYRILVVEDDRDLNDEIILALERWGYYAEGIEDFNEVYEEIRKKEPQLVLMDINLPKYDGFHWCRKIREISKIPIIFLSSRDNNMDIIMAINMGGDDFITKPFDIEVLVAKIKAQLRRTYSYKEVNENITESFGVILKLDEGKLLYNGESVILTRNELRILSLMMSEDKKIISRSKMMKALWDDDQFINENTLTVNINRLRNKLSEIGLKEFIQTQKGVGYFINADY